jgi:Ca2+/Na+ antiporter
MLVVKKAYKGLTKQPKKGKIDNGNICACSKFMPRKGENMPPIVQAILLLVVGFVLLVKGADWFVDGAAGVAGKAKIPQLVIGLTVVAFGTSAPELAVSLSSAASSGGIALGNVVGSNITNILLILGLSAIFTALPVGKWLKTIDFPVLMGVSALFVLFIWTGNTLERWEGIVLAAILVGYTVFLVVHSLAQKKKGLITFEEEEEEEPKNGFEAWYAKMKDKVWFLLILLFAGLAMVVGGGVLAADNAEIIARELGVDEKVIGFISVPHPTVLAAIDKKCSVAFLEIVTEDFAAITPAPVSYKLPSKFPEIEIDLTFSAELSSLKFDEVKTCAKAASSLLSDVFVKDIYYAEDGSCALTLRFAFVSYERTLTKQELTPVTESVAAALAPLGLTVKE